MLLRFQSEIADFTPHRDPASGNIINPTPLVDLTADLTDFAKSELGVDLPAGATVFGKLDSKIFGGSVKVRAAVQIITHAIATGSLTNGMTVFEATSGNFGLALALLGRLDFRVIALVSRKLQKGVLDRLESAGVKLVNLDVDICPSPGTQGTAEAAVAKGIAASVRLQLEAAGLNPMIFDRVRAMAETLLAAEDVIGLAKLLARAYGGFCPEQYDSELNVKAHEDVTGPEIDQQLIALGFSPLEFDVACAFGTGGTAAGLSKYARKTRQRRSVHVVFPMGNQEVAGIRTKEKASGMRFYQPSEYASEQEVDFGLAKRLLGFLNERGHDVGESGVLAIFAALRLIVSGSGRRIVVLVADGASKYGIGEEAAHDGTVEVALAQAAADSALYGGVVWTHWALVPKQAGLTAIASAIGINEKSVRVAKPRELEALLSGSGIPEVFAYPERGKRLLLVCMAGETSIMMAKALAQRGVRADSLSGGISGILRELGAQPLDYVEDVSVLAE
ncbi:MAG TPA: pyridoxal-phosphate dependent enzyme [Nitrososphaerales archaeon]|nr:pyridoxal-phosphate dependent enzyme [Nitrososphaerales archaeon]